MADQSHTAENAAQCHLGYTEYDGARPDCGTHGFITDGRWERS